jgi:hypothetical protein
MKILLIIALAVAAFGKTYGKNSPENQYIKAGPSLNGKNIVFAVDKKLLYSKNKNDKKIIIKKYSITEK